MLVKIRVLLNITCLNRLILRKNYCVSLREDMEKFNLPLRYVGNDKKMWIEYIQLALDYKPLDLGHGFPDFAPPDHIIQALKNVTSANNTSLHQYTAGFGHPRLLAALAKLYSPLVLKDIHPGNNLLIGYGAYEILSSTIFGHIDTGDEVIIIEPFFDCYEPMVRVAGGIPKFIPLRLHNTGSSINAGDFVLDSVELENMFNNKTKAIIINTPNNPLGKVFTKEELDVIANLCKKWNVLCISDEVYEWIVYPPNQHIRIASLPDMWERTITIGSAGKTFSITGWKIGWAYGPTNLIHNLKVVHQNSVYICPTPLQEAIAISIEKELSRFNRDDCYFVSLARELITKRNFMADILNNAGMVPILPQGGYFMLADWSPLASKLDLTTETDCYKDFRFTKWMIKNVGVQGIPPTAFYSQANKHLIENYVRYCFIKENKNLERAGDILQKWKRQVIQ